ncbi:PilZ domain-containing protein [Stakelama tenebrarum]|uniref:PilZ domain-containing protein n=1 Tax=Stakelama tenebrarum TaxID=2711215 RepID=A0A6G6Y665_9SPHN|nr:PilZ domain-containing protein [Sphingosinithalassobacter tenebrarum]QIG80287.1 PilZ domain-containing protein [Sphingosinithalassobacter tenebrarum]
MFAAEVEPAIGLGRRRSARKPVSLDAKLGRGGLERALCRVVDLSRHGARLQTYSSLRPSTTVWLTLPLIGHFGAKVVWADDFEAGLEFLNPLSDDQFESIVPD